MTMTLSVTRGTTGIDSRRRRTVVRPCRCRRRRVGAERSLSFAVVFGSALALLRLDPRLPARGRLRGRGRSSKAWGGARLRSRPCLGGLARRPALPRPRPPRERRRRVPVVSAVGPWGLTVAGSVRRLGARPSAAEVASAVAVPPAAAPDPRRRVAHGRRAARPAAGAGRTPAMHARPRPAWPRWSTSGDRPSRRRSARRGTTSASRGRRRRRTRTAPTSSRRRPLPPRRCRRSVRTRPRPPRPRPPRRRRLRAPEPGAANPPRRYRSPSSHRRWTPAPRSTGRSPSGNRRASIVVHRRSLRLGRGDGGARRADGIGRAGTPVGASGRDGRAGRPRLVGWTHGRGDARPPDLAALRCARGKPRSRRALPAAALRVRSRGRRGRRLASPYLAGSSRPHGRNPAGKPAPGYRTPMVPDGIRGGKPGRA